MTKFLKSNTCFFIAFVLCLIGSLVGNYLYYRYDVMDSILIGGIVLSDVLTLIIFAFILIKKFVLKRDNFIFDIAFAFSLYILLAEIGSEIIEIIKYNHSIEHIIWLILGLITRLSIISCLLLEKNLSFKSKKISSIVMLVGLILFCLTESFYGNYYKFILTIVISIIMIVFLSIGKGTDNNLPVYNSDSLINVPYRQFRMIKFSSLVFIVFGNLFMLAIFVITFKEFPYEKNMAGLITSLVVSIILILIELAILSFGFLKHKISIFTIIVIFISTFLISNDLFFDFIRISEDFSLNYLYYVVFEIIVCISSWIPVIVPAFLFASSKHIKSSMKAVIICLTLFPYIFIDALFHFDMIFYILLLGYHGLFVFYLFFGTKEEPPLASNNFVATSYKEDYGEEDTYITKVDYEDDYEDYDD